MRVVLLGLAAGLAATAAVPAGAIERPEFPQGFKASSDGFGDFRDGRRHHRRNRGGDTVLIYDRDYQGDSAWRPNSFNDWWHERPERAFPRWMQNNQDCQKVWYAGSVLRC